MERYSSIDSASDYDGCSQLSIDASLPFDPNSLENLILNIADTFDVKVLVSNEKMAAAVVVTSGLAIAGGIIGNHCGGKLGAAVGTAIGGACGVGMAAISMREVWNDLRHRLTELYDIVYDYLAGLGIEDYKKAALFITSGNSTTEELVQVVVQVASKLLGKKVVSCLTGAQY